MKSHGLQKHTFCKNANSRAQPLLYAREILQRPSEAAPLKLLRLAQRQPKAIQLSSTHNPHACF